MYPVNKEKNFWDCLDNLEVLQNQITKIFPYLSSEKQKILENKDFKENINEISQAMLDVNQIITQVITTFILLDLF